MSLALPVKVLTVAHYHQRPGCHPTPNVTPRGMERVELLTGGRGWVQHEDAWVEVLPGTLIWQVAGDSTIGRSDFDNPYRCLSIAFQVTQLRHPTRPVRRITKWADLPALREFTDELVRLWVEKTIPEDALRAYAYGRLRIQALIGQHQLERLDLPAQVRRARELIEKRYASRLTVPDLASAAGCSGPYLHELFKEHLGTSPYQLILQYRLKEAARRLSSTDQPIKQVAADLGFAHPAAFCQAFRRYAGYTPALYRRRSHALP